MYFDALQSFSNDFFKEIFNFFVSIELLPPFRLGVFSYLADQIPLLVRKWEFFKSVNLSDWIVVKSESFCYWQKIKFVF